jgi:glycosyltransferase involved in cell wall biosynthesis
LDASKLLQDWVPHQKLQPRLAKFHVFGFPSIREFGGGVVLEAMAMGIVPIIVDYGGPGELVTPQTGFAMPMGSRETLIQELRRILARLVADRTSLGPMAARGRERVARVATWFTWEAKARQVAKVYDWVLGRGAKPEFGMPFPDLETPLSATG